ncbi:MAG: hypothetical protein L0I24_13900, partial [Pseudonocardia sp.]|nr:hypothetical protein [Pseudonocardia sp.]
MSHPGSGAHGRAGLSPRSRLTGFAGIGYAVGVGVENMDVLETPGLGSPADAVRAALLDSARVLVGAVSGGVALVLFVV